MEKHNLKIGQKLKVGREVVKVVKIVSETRFVAENKYNQEYDMNGTHEYEVLPVVEKLAHVGKHKDEWGARATPVHRYRISYGGESKIMNSWWCIGDLRKVAKRIIGGYKAPICTEFERK